jgi:prepilin-type N-terminal cleavage/methylation domain-containing protein
MRTIRTSGFTLVEIMIVVAIIGLLAAMALPSFVRARNVSQQTACINNLRIIDSGKEQCSMVYHMTDGDPVLTVSVNEYIKGATTPLCPTSGTYGYGSIGSNPRCTVSSPTSHHFAGLAD